MFSIIEENQESQSMIKKVLSNAILSIFMDKKAKMNFFAFLKNRMAKTNNEGTQSTIATNKSSQKSSKGLNAEKNRQLLIKKALVAHEENSHVLANLNEDQKQKLRQLAIQIFLNTVKGNKSKYLGIEKTNAKNTRDTETTEVLTETENEKRKNLIKNALASHKKYSKALDNLSELQKKN